MVTILLIRKIVQLFFIMILGYVTVKAKLLKADESAVLSKLSLYLVMPCVIINSFQVEFTEEIKLGLIFAFGTAAAIHILLIAIGCLAKHFLHTDAVEQASIIYSNAATLIIPIVSSVLGPEWVVYSSAFVTVQSVFLWTHCKQLFAAEQKADFRKIFLSINMISIFAGIFLLVTGIRLPSMVNETLASVGAMVGPVGMLITGMLVAKMDPRQIFLQKRIYLILLFRMVLCPLTILALFKLFNLRSLVPNGEQILLILFLSTTTPAAATITQFAQIHNKDAEYAGAINILTTLACIVTMPVFVFLYYL